jgi:hypothetical protein
MKKLWLRFVCYLNGHDWPGDHFHGNALTFCRRCGAEIAGRTVADLEPMTEDERDYFTHYEDWGV